VSQLIEFDALLTKVGANVIDHQIVLNEMMLLVRLQINELLKHAYAWSVGNEYSGSDNGLNNTSLYYNDVSKQWLQIYIHNGRNYISGCKKESPPYDSALHWNHVGMGTWKNKYTNETKKSVNNPVSKKSVWYDVSLKDYKTAMDSILLMSYHEAFCLNFGPEKIRMESFLRKFEVMQHDGQFSRSQQSNNCMSMFRALTGRYDDDGIFIPNNKDLYDIFVHFEMSSQLSNPDHWGHLTWLFCKFMDSKRPTSPLHLI
jgi:hypothetical protein